MTRSLIILRMRALKATGLSKVIRVVESRRSDWIPDVWRSWTIDVGVTTGRAVPPCGEQWSGR